MLSHKLVLSESKNFTSGRSILAPPTIHETNLKKQGMLGLTFAKESDYDLIQEDDTFAFSDLVDFAPGKQLTLDIVHTDGTTDAIKLNHTYNASQIAWFHEGSALNLIKKQNA